MLEPYLAAFVQNEIDGYTLLNLTEEEMVSALKIGDKYHREYLRRAIKKLVVVWIRYGKNCENFFREQADSIYFDEQSIINQTTNDLEVEGTSAFSIKKMMDEAEKKGTPSPGRQSVAQDLDPERAEKLSNMGMALTRQAEHLSGLLL